MTHIDVDSVIGFTFKEYGVAEKAKLERAIRSLTIWPAGVGRPFPEACAPLDEAWAVGGFEEVFPKIDGTTRKTAAIGHRFVSKRRNDPSRADSFFWRVERLEGCLTSALAIVLKLVSPNPELGLIGLEQVVLRLGEDEFVYWGVG